MKKIQLFAWMILALMCLSFSGCGATSSEEEPYVTQLMLARFDDSSYSNNCFYDINGLKIIPTDLSILTGVMSTGNGIYQFTVNYNPDLVTNDQVTANFNSTPASIMNPFGVVSSSEVIIDNNILLYALDYAPRQLAPFMFDKDYLVIPVVYQGVSTVNESEIATELGKHRFVLLWEPYGAGDKTLNLILTDKVTDPDTERFYPLFTYQAFNLRDVIANFKAQGNSLEKIVIKAKIGENTNDLERATEKTYSIEYNY